MRDDCGLTSNGSPENVVFSEGGTGGLNENISGSHWTKFNGRGPLLFFHVIWASDKVLRS